MTTRVTRSLSPLVLALLAALVLAACQAIERLPADVGLAPAPLVTVEMSGGRCVDGPCASQATLDASGRMVMFDGTETTIPSERVARIVDSIAATDWSAVMANPFQGECPTAFDGAERTWTIQTPAGALEIADCTVAVDYDADPFRLLNEEFFATGG
jgi:hypothetical protein